MQKLTSTDIGVLYRSLVILPDDRLSSMDNAEKELAKKKPSTHLKEPVTDKPEVEDPKSQYGLPHPFVILTTPRLKEAYLAENSPFQKIITALNIPQTAKYLTTDSALLQNPQNVACLWCIGLDIATEKVALNSNHPAILISPDLLRLTSNEEKKAMYRPLKTFITANMSIIQQT